jgi:predicted metalloprotease with PDZ domain
MATLYRDFYKRGKGFTTEDLLAVINRITRRDYGEFFNRYVWGVEVPPYDTILSHAGYRTEKGSQKIPDLGMAIEFKPEGITVTRVPAGTNAARAGVEAGDIIVGLDEIDVQKEAGKAFERLGERVDKNVTLTIKRGGENKKIEMLVGSESQTSFRVAELSGATSAQLKVREAWLKAAR